MPAHVHGFQDADGYEGRCDARCYGATHPDCDCVCRGMNHGKGLRQAADNTQRLADQWVDTWRQEHPDAQVQMAMELA